jgi:hypothetical protein
MRIEALNKLDNIAILTAIAQSDSMYEVRMAAREKAGLAMDTPLILADIAQNDYHASARREAVEHPHLTDQSVLTHVAKNDVDRLVRLYATRKLTELPVLAEIAAKDTDIFVCAAAARIVMEKTTDRAITKRMKQVLKDYERHCQEEREAEERAFKKYLEDSY